MVFTRRSSLHGPSYDCVASFAFNAGDEIVIYDAVTSRSAAVLYVGTGGNVRVLTAGGDDVVIVGAGAGEFIPINVVKVFATNTTASDILALW